MYDPESPAQAPAPSQSSPGSPLQIPLPGLSSTVGLGGAISGLLSGLGVQPCGGCKARAQALDRRVQFRPWDS